MDREVREVEHTRRTIDDAHAASSNAGLLFLLNVLSRLGIERWLGENEDWAAWGFVPRLFLTLCAKLRVAAADPIFAALPTIASIENEQGACQGFCVPSTWLMLAGDGLFLQRTSTVGAAQIITALSGRLPLAGWRTNEPSFPYAQSYTDRVRGMGSC